MANSKSNIYPIQLQGADLNLNKFDAEIKQYSGFNQNNAPFVGGCLSNLFTKNEQITDGNADNVYIAPNGDVYRVDDNAFYKNDEILFEREQVFNYDRKSRRLDITEMFQDEKDEVVFICEKYVDKLIYVTQVQKKINGENYQACIHIGDKVFYASMPLSGYNFVGFSVNAVKTSSNNSNLELYLFSFEIYAATNAISNPKAAIALFECCINKNTGATFSKWGTTPTYISFYSDYELNNIPVVKTKYNAQYQDDVILFGFGALKYFLTLTGYDENGLPNYTQTQLTTLTLNAATGHNLSSTDISDYFFTDDKCFLLTGRSAVAKAFLWGNWNISQDNTAIVVNGSNIGSFAADIYKPVASLNSLFNRFSPVIIYLFYNSSNNLSGVSAVGTAKQYRCVTVGSETEDLKKYHLNIGIKINNFILANNGQYTGFCNVQAENNPTDDYEVIGCLLLAGWNNIDINKVFTFRTSYNENLNMPYIIYQDAISKKWYKIATVEYNKIMKKENQLVVNWQQLHNAYDLNTGKVLTFAPSWNNDCGSFDRLYNYYVIPLTMTQNNYYIATSINEYSQENNPSIILNPVPVAYAPYISGIHYFNVFTNYPNVNFYSGTNATDVKYNRSFNTKTGLGFADRNLEGLPFPIDTNGNVAYSPSLFAEFFSSFGNDVFVKEGNNAYQLSKYNNQPIMSFYLGTLVEGLSEVFVLQGQYYGIINNQIFALQFYNGVVSSQTSVVSVQGLQFCGNTPYEALFFSKTNKCLYSFTGANILNSKQFVDKIEVVKDYEYNPSTQSIFLLTDIGIIVYSLFGTYQIDIPNANKMYLLNNGVCIVDEDNNFRYVRYYKAEDYLKENIKLETCFYGMNNQTVTINDCLYMRIFSEEHDEGDLEVSATTLSLKGRVTEKTTFKIKADDWDKETHTIYLRYQPKEQRGLGISFKVESPFKIAALSVGSQADAILVDKVSKGAINAPFTNKSSTIEW